jgi:hypothetical protein
LRSASHDYAYVSLGLTLRLLPRLHPGRRRKLPAGELCVQSSREKIFFSEEKKQKTFMSVARGKIPAMASIGGAAEK